jgi:hypothetical protein
MQAIPLVRSLPPDNESAKKKCLKETFETPNDGWNA